MSNDCGSSIPSDYLSVLFEQAAEGGLSRAALLKGSNVPLESISNVSARIESKSINQIIENFLENQGPEAAILFGQRMSNATHGWMGVASQSSDTLYDCWIVIKQFMRIRTFTSVSIDLSEDEDYSYFRFHSNEPECSPQALFFINVSILISTDCATRGLYGKSLEPVQSELRLKSSNPFSDYKPLIRSGLTISFDQPHNELVWPKKYMKKPLISANPLVKKTAIAECDKELLLLESTEDMSTSVRLILRDTIRHSPGVESVAEQLNVSVSTMRRKLKDQGTSFQAIKDSERLDLAKDLLKTTDKNLEDIAEYIGYTDSSNFNKAFKKWVGKTPREYRLLPT